MRKFYLLLVVTVLMTISGCNQDVINKNEVSPDTSDTLETNQNLEEIETIQPVEEVIETEELEEEAIETVVPEEEVEEEIIVEEVIDLRPNYKAHKVNEAGQMMVIMYHNLSDQVGDYATTKELFIKDLERLYEMGFVTISMSDLVNNTIDIPIGKTPVVLTFDDATKSNFYYEADGSISKNSVVGILDEFYESHEAFGKNAIFYLYGSNPFREKDFIQAKLDYLLEEGYEIGTHTYTHKSFKELDGLGIQRTLGLNQAFINEYIDHEMIHLSIPYGIRPYEDSLEYMFNGSFEGQEYHIESAVNVGWNPIYGPSHTKFNPKSINRITCGDDNAELHYWLDYFVNHPEKRYYSDGDPETTVVPISMVDQLKDDLHTQVITYEEE